MGLTALDIFVLLAVGGAAVLGLMRGFVTEVLSLFAWVAIVFALKLFHTPLAHMLAGSVGTVTGAAVLAFAIISGVTYFGGRMVARAIGARTRDSILGPVDRALGFGFGALKGLILASLGFLLVVLMTDTVHGGRVASARLADPVAHLSAAQYHQREHRRFRRSPAQGPAGVRGERQ